MPQELNRTRLTAGRVAAFSCPASKSQAFLWDTDAPSLLLRATPTGRKTYAMQGRLGGKTIRVTIGDVRTWSLADARAEAARLKLQIDSGLDPRELARQQQAERAAREAMADAQALTMGDVWPVYMQARRPHWGARHFADNAAAVRSGGKAKKRGKGLTEPGPLNHFCAMRLVDVTPQAVRVWAEGEGKTRPTQARLALHLLQAFLNWCASEPHYAALVPDGNAATNRAAREALGKPKAKHDALLKEQLPAWFQAVRSMGNATMAAYLQALVLTGARPGELQALRWEDVNTQWRGLTLRDKAESKGGQDGTREIPLTPYVWHVLAGLPRRGPFVFAGASGAPIHKPNVQHTKACKVAAIDGLTLHGLRRSFKSLSEWLELPAGVVAQIMGHKPSATAEKHYTVRPLDLLRLHHEKLEAWILEQARVKFDASAESGKLRVVTH